MDQQFLSSASAAKRLGVSAKALRLYEQHGLVAPTRTRAGWRAYGPSQIARLHQVLALKDLGLSLSGIADLLAGNADKLDLVLELQERALTKELSRISHGLSLVRLAQQKRTHGAMLSVEDLLKLMREVTVLTPLWEKHFTTAELDGLMSRDDLNSAEFASTQEQLKAEIKILAAKGNPNSPEALALGRRWLAQCELITRGDKKMGKKIGAITAEAMADPNTSAELPLTPELYAFLALILQHLNDKPPTAR
jgi:DNA-binding transcriptional MerR regulator